ncbi:hypothetical protein QA601_16265 [Chitinispirillales bacterium ANBcel5]|uniref:hypothetical protein n=1 Tax=Cellulosispirillum alkaliphilum TaxID=3039283 RepID=UPI002A576274|nr:hypothetical protein [Chitinispirillales bacterium ANBcel5]
MDNKFVFLIISCIVFSCSANNNTKSKADILIDSLFSSTFQQKYQYNAVDDILKLIQKESAYIKDHSRLIEFMENNERYGVLAMPYLVYMKSSNLLESIANNRHKITREFCGALDWTTDITDSTTHHFYISQIIDRLLPVIDKIQDEWIRGDFYRVIRRVGNFKQVNDLIANLGAETNRGARAELLGALLRFSDEGIEGVFNSHLKKGIDQWTLDYVLESGFQRFNRHDFLPLLYSLQTELENETDVRKIEDAKRTLERLNEVIPYLEQKKAEGVKPGLPLDWGVVD